MDQLLQNTYFLIYVAGCISAALLIIINSAIGVLIKFATNTYTLERNVKKLNYDHYVKLSFFKRAEIIYGKVIRYIVLLLISIMSSWIEVALQVFSFVKLGVRLFSSLFERTPQEIVNLRFPLHKNPNMEPEAVWAHLTAIAIKGGQLPAEFTAIDDGLKELSDEIADIASFNSVRALDYLEQLNVVDRSVVNILKRLHKSNNKKKDVAAGAISDTLARFESDMLQNAAFPDAHSGRNVHIFRFLMKPWSQTLLTEARRDPAATKKFNDDIVEYMDTLDSLRSNSFREMMAHQKGNHAQERNYQRDRESDQYSLQDIEDRFAQSVGWDAISKLHNVRAIEKIGAFSRIGELAPDGWFFMDGKLVPEQNWDAASPRA